MKQTAVEWLIEQIKSDHIDKALNGLEWMKIFEQAKEMEREQMASNCSRVEISDAEIAISANQYCEKKPTFYEIQIEKNNAFIYGARWYREQLKQK